MNNSKLFNLKSIVLIFGMLLLGSSLVQSLAQSTAAHLSYQPSPAEIAKYGPGFPAYCSAYSSRPECAAIYGLQPIPVEPDPCYITGGYQPGCVPTQLYPCLPGDPSPSCLPSTPVQPPLPPGCIIVGGDAISCPTPPVGYPQPYPIPLPPPVICVDGLYHSECYPQPYPLPIPPPPPPSVYDFRLATPPPTANCQSGYSPHCLAIAPMKAFHHSYAISPAIPTYRVGETLEYRVNSPYSGYLYVFVEESDGRLKVLYPNAYTGAASYIHAGTVLDLPGSGAQYSLDVTAPYGLHKLFSVVTTLPLPRYLDENVHSQADLNTILLDLGITAGIYHGYAETAFNVVY